MADGSSVSLTPNSVASIGWKGCIDQNGFNSVNDLTACDCRDDTHDHKPSTLHILPAISKSPRLFAAFAAGAVSTPKLQQTISAYLLESPPPGIALAGETDFVSERSASETICVVA